MNSKTFRPFGSLRFATIALCAVLSGACKEKSSDGGTSAAASGKAASVLLDEASDAMDRKEWTTALSRFDVVVADPKATADEKASAWEDKVICEGHAHDDAAAIAAIEKMKVAKVELTASQYGRMIQELTAADRLDAAVAAIAAGTERFKGDEATKAKFEKAAEILSDRMAEKGDTAGQDKLRALGYVGSKKK